MMTPSRTPMSSTPGQRHPGRGEIDPARVPQVPQLLEVDQARHGDEHDGGQNGLRQASEEAGEEEKHQADHCGGENQRQRRACAALLVDRALRQPARDGEALPEARQEAGRPQTEELLPRIHRVAVLQGEGARGRNALDVGQQEAGERQTGQLAKLLDPEVAQARGDRQKVRQPRGSVGPPPSRPVARPGPAKPPRARAPRRPARRAGRAGTSLPRPAPPIAATPMASVERFVSGSCRTRWPMR